MICRKCGADIADNSIRCSNCGIKTKMYCPLCHTLNTFGEKYCVKCGTELLLSCSVCGATNIYYASDCRKCHSPLIKGTKPNIQKTKDIEVVESFSSEETTYISQEQDAAVKVTHDIENKSLPVIEKVKPDYNNNNVENVFGVEEGFKPIIINEEPKTEDLKEEDNLSFEFDELLDDNNDSEDILPDISTESEEKKEEKEQTEEIVSDNREECTENTQNRENIENEKIRDEGDYYIPFQTEDFLSVQNNSNINIQQKTVEEIADLIKNSLNKHIIAVNGPEGCGKSAVLKQVSETLVENGYLSLYGSCTQLIRITSFGFFQDAFLRIMGFPPYTMSKESFIKEFTNSSFTKVFSFLKGNDLTLFLNIFYPSQKDDFENILKNKLKIFSILEKVIKSFLVNNNLLILIDNFDLLDGASYDFIVHMMKNGYFNGRLKLLAAYQENKDIKSFFELSAEEENMFETVELKKLSKTELIEAVERNTFIKIDDIISEEEVNKLVEKSDGNAIRMEQEVAFLFDSEYLKLNGNEVIINSQYKQENKESTFEELIKQRINTLPPAARNLLFMAAIMGYRFSKSILCLSVTMPVEKAEELLNFLIKNLFVQHVDNYTCEFKSLNLWQLIYQEAKSDLLYKDNAKRLYLSLKPLILSSNLQKLISCNEALTDNEEFLIWRETASLSAKLGDTNLYIISLRQSLKLIEEKNIEDGDQIKRIIYEEMGKLLYEKSPQEAVIYLSNILDYYIKEADVRKVIDISSYFIKSCYITGNYFGAVEAVDAVLDTVLIPGVNVSSLQKALIKTRKLNALLNIGNSEQIINLTEEEIIPEIEKNLNVDIPINGEYKEIILDAWFTAKITLAKAYAMQGNIKVNNIIGEVKNAINKYDYNTEYYQLHIGIVEAFGNTIEGDIHKSNEILNNISTAYKTKSMNSSLLAWWNLVSIINRVLLNKKENLRSDLFELVVYANNINEHFIKNIVKLILGYILEEEGNIEKAEEIYNEQIVYFAKEKVAMGALFAWALIVQKYIKQEEYDKALKTATKSLDIAQSSKINNYIFVVYFQKFMAEIYLKKADYIAAKMYLEKSIVIAKQFELKYQLIELYVEYAKYVQELMKSKKIYSKDNLDTVHEMYKKAIDTAKELALHNMLEYANKEYSSFKTYCQLNSIEV